MRSGTVKIWNFWVLFTVPSLREKLVQCTANPEPEQLILLNLKKNVTFQQDFCYKLYKMLNNYVNADLFGQWDTKDYRAYPG